MLAPYRCRSRIHLAAISHRRWTGAAWMLNHIESPRIVVSDKHEANAFSQVRSLSSFSAIIQDKSSREEQASFKREVAAVKTRVKLLTRVKELLHQQEFRHALGLMRAAAGVIKSSACWDQIILFLLKRREFDNAFQVYEQMHKFGVVPDHYTASYLLRGLAEPPVTDKQVHLALTLSESFKNPDSSITFNEHIVTGIMQVLSRAGEFDLLRKFFARVAKNEPKLINSNVYGSLFHSMLKELEAIGEAHATSELREQYRSIWNEIMHKWELGDLDIDAPLLNGYLDLLEQEPDMDGHLERLKIIGQLTGIGPMDFVGHAPREEPGLVLGHVEEKHSLPDSDGLRSRPTLIAIDHGLFSHMLTAAYESHFNLPSGWKSVDWYWDVVTGRLGLQPTETNYKHYLAWLRRTANSQKAMQVVELAYALHVRAGKYRPSRSIHRMALAVCANAARRKPQPSIETTISMPFLAHAKRIFDLAGTVDPMGDHLLQTAYLSCAVETISAVHIVETMLGLRARTEEMLSQIDYVLPLLGARSKKVVISEADYHRAVGAFQYLKFEIASIVTITDSSWSRKLVREVGQNKACELQQWKDDLEGWLLQRGILNSPVAPPHTGLEPLPPSNEERTRKVRRFESQNHERGAIVTYPGNIDIEERQQATLRILRKALEKKWGDPTLPRAARRKSRPLATTLNEEQRVEDDEVESDAPKPRASFPTFITELDLDEKASG
ncbi:hypothetical protein KVT40_000934 [Elsinoe batatas]|uniref:Pentatricopeptide repeat domain-containing protein n=1 Tax=Elsinoe batatas TaxID=2601811 RepID=A0A8K0LAZ5_9PEZI|nr:hypothetical protein KVT40_000934 [Elsinoe batatas]